MEHSREAVQDVDLDAPLPPLDKTENYTTVKGKTWYSMPNENSMVCVHEVDRPKLVTLLRTGEELAFDYGDGSLRVEISASMRTDLPDMVKIVF